MVTGIAGYFLGHAYADMSVIDKILTKYYDPKKGFAEYQSTYDNIGDYFNTIIYHQVNIGETSDSSSFLSVYGGGVGIPFYGSIHKIRIYPKTYNPITNPVDQITLYKNKNFGGISKKFSSTQNSLFDFNDMTSSIKIPRTWKVRFFEHASFEGRSFELTGGEVDDFDFLDNTISSFKITDKEFRKNIILYSEPNYKGTKLTIPITGYDGDVSELNSMTNKASSIQVPDNVSIGLFKNKNNKVQSLWISKSTPDLRLYGCNNDIEYIEYIAN